LTVWARLVFAVLAVYLLFQWSAGALGSVRGEAGLVVAAIVVAATAACERFLFARRPAAVLPALGFGRARRWGMAVAIAISAALLSVIPIFAAATDTPVTLRSDWLWLVPGLFAQAGIAEEALFRGFLFGHLRESRSFWRAATLSMIPFLVAHLYLFFTMPASVAAFAVALSVVLSFPLAQLFELGGRTIWAPAVVHAVVQGGLKIVDVPEEVVARLAALWMAACALLPLPVLLMQRPPIGSRPRRNGPRPGRSA
jgi:membrane protease YdiL (CAAX protease family)